VTIHRLLLPLFLICLASAEERSLTILHFNDLHAAMTSDSSGRGGIVPLAG
jgi:2',3'-cyclic-nucleotide 2'-phosphodiesterase (5'-nucleotidase family)